MLKINKTLIRVVIAAAVFVMIAMIATPHVYILKKIDPQQVAVQIRSGRVVNVVGPGGVYSDIGLYTELIAINVDAVLVDVTDPELITKDKQRLGLQVTADIFRPGAGKFDIILDKWGQYRLLFTDNDALRQRINSFALQSMKVCVGDRTFDQATIGSGRDELRQCIDDELSMLASSVGLDVQNVTVPQIIISPEVQVALDAIVQSRLATEKARQDAEKAKQEAAAKQAAQEGEIRVQQSIKQEEARQQTALADLERQRLEAQLAVLEASMVNAEKERELNKLKREVAALQAQIDLAKEIALAEVYVQNPVYAAYQMALVNAGAIKNTDKLIFAQEGAMPNLVFSNGYSIPTLPGYSSGE